MLFLAYFAVAYLYPAGMGFGDVKLAGIVGGVLGFISYPVLAVGAFAAFAIGSVVGIGQDCQPSGHGRQLHCVRPVHDRRRAAGAVCRLGRDRVLFEGGSWRLTEPDQLPRGTGRAHEIQPAKPRKSPKKKRPRAQPLNSDGHAIGLDLGATSVRAAVLALSTKSGRPSVTVARRGLGAAADRGHRQRRGGRPGRRSPQALQELWASNGFKCQRVILGVANPQVVVRPLQIPNLNAQQRAKALPFQAREIIALPLDEVILDYAQVGDADPETGMVSGLLIATPRGPGAGRGRSRGAGGSEGGPGRPVLLRCAALDRRRTPGRPGGDRSRRPADLDRDPRPRRAQIGPDPGPRRTGTDRPSGGQNWI